MTALDMEAPRTPVSVRATAVVTFDDGVTATIETTDLDLDALNAPGQSRCVYGMAYPDGRHEDDLWPSERAYYRGLTYLTLDAQLRAADPDNEALFTVTMRPPVADPDDPTEGPRP